MSATFFLAAGLIWLLALIFTLAGRPTVYRPLTPLAGVLSLVAAVWALRAPWHFIYLVSPAGPLSLRLDPLGAYFLLVYALVTIAVGLYAPAYDRHLPAAEQRLVAVYGPLFQLSMLLVIGAGDLFSFFLAWEGMSLASYFLVTSRRDDPQVTRAGYVYIVMTHAATMAALLGLLLLAGTAGSIDFGALASAAHQLGGQRDLIFVLLLIGFGTKAAIIPWHVWLPRAHPVAPSPVSALMSGVMIKLGIYALLRFITLLGGPVPVWWGGLILGLGIISAVLGVIYALMEHDLKRLLAYHSIENIGIILLGLGAYLLARSIGSPVLATLALGAALFHTLNHALFKSSLFLGAGAVAQATGTQEMDRLGGLLKLMPLTGITFLASSAAISGLPPFNGFMSEWLTYQALIRLSHSTGFWLAALALFASLALALTGALASACFVKAFGVTFTGRPRSQAAEAAREVAWGMRLGPALLAGLSLILGLFPSLILPSINLAAGGHRLPPWSGAWGLSLFHGSSTVSTLGIFLLLVGLVAILLRLRGPVVVTEPWVCGLPFDQGQQLTTVSFSKSFRQMFSFFLRPERSVSEPLGYFAGEVRYEGKITPIFDRYLYQPALQAVLRVSGWARAVQSGSLRLYLTYLLLTLLLLLAIARSKGGMP